MYFGMKKIMILAMSAILVANVSAQELKKEFKDKQFTKEERVDFEIKRLTHELMLSDEQAERFAATYRDYADELGKIFEKNAPKGEREEGKELNDKELDKLAKARFVGFKELADLQSKFYDKFRKDLSARQVEKVMHLDAPFGPKPCCGKCEKHDGQGPRPEGPHPDGPHDKGKKHKEHRRQR